MLHVLVESSPALVYSNIYDHTDKITNQNTYVLNEGVKTNGGLSQNTSGDYGRLVGDVKKKIPTIS